MSQRSPFNQRNMSKIGTGAANADAEAEKPASAGMAHKSPSSAKPAREAAGSVRVVKQHKNLDGSTSTVGMTKEEKKAQRNAEREEERFVEGLVDSVMKLDPLYRKYRRTWWIFMAIGVVCVALSFGCGYIDSPAGENIFKLGTIGGIASVVFLFLAYAFIITTIVWEFKMIRPLRRTAEHKITSMSDKKRHALMEEIYEAEEKRRAEKKSGK